jgi:hypothetical protein
MNEKILRIPYSAVNNDWNFLQKYLKAIGNPRYIIVGNVKLCDRQDISDLGNLVGVEGELDLSISSIESLGELEYVGEDLWLSGCKNITTLGKLKKVDGNLSLRKSSIKSLGELEFVIGNFNLVGSSIESLGELTFVGGFLNLSNCKKIKTLGKLKKVDGNLVLEYSTIVSLGSLEFVGDSLWIEGIKQPPSELDNVEIIGKIYR